MELKVDRPQPNQDNNISNQRLNVCMNGVGGQAMRDHATTLYFMSLF